jgi:hypothetical protein
MIFSKDHNFLLLKNQKVGGTSLEIALSMVVPENAIVTPRTSNHPEWAIKDEKVFVDYKPRNYEGFYNHIPYSDIQKLINLKNVKSYIFIRNPYDAVLSHFFHRLYFINKNNNWDELKEQEKNNLIVKYFNNELGWPWHTSNKYIYLSKKNKIQVNEFLFYEDGIELEINKVLPKHNIPQIKITAQEKTFKPKNIKPKDIFSKIQLQKIYNEWNWEFNEFGYEK